MKRARKSRNKKSNFFNKYKLPLVVAIFLTVVVIILSFETSFVERFGIGRFDTVTATCGQEIITDTILASDLIGCTNDYIINITANDVTLDCDNHLIAAGGVWHGIFISPETTGVTIKNCEVRLEGESIREDVGGQVVGARYAIEANNANIIDSNFYVSGQMAAEFGSENIIDDCIFNAKVMRAIVIKGNNNQIINSRIISNNYLISILLDSQGNLFTDNNILAEQPPVVNIPGGIDNVFYNNMFSINAQEYPGYIYSPNTNIWNLNRQEGERIYSDGEQIGGNYWTNSEGTGYSDLCVDDNTDGFCDEPWDIWLPDDGQADYYPLSNFYLEGVCGDGILDGNEECDDGNVLNDDGCTSVCNFETIIFVTNDTWYGTLDGIEGANAKCMDEATSYGLGGIWQAMLSADTHDNLRDRIDTDKFPVYNVLGEQVAANIVDLLNANPLDASIGYTLDRELHLADHVWTGTDADGVTADEHCSNWNPEYGVTDLGTAALMGELHPYEYEIYCDAFQGNLPIYCSNILVSESPCTNECDPVGYPMCNKYVSEVELLTCELHTDGCYYETAQDCGDSCEQGECVELTPDCQTDEDCDYDMICVANQCALPPPQCQTDEDCEGIGECTNGECTLELDFCTDSDGGKVPYVFGETYGRISTEGVHYDTVPDYCSLSVIQVGIPKEELTCSGDDCAVTEHFCQYSEQLGEEWVSFENIHCPNGCEAGACLSANTPCTTADDCGPGEICQDNICMEVDEVLSCPTAIDIAFNQEVYREGDLFIWNVWIYNSEGDLVPNRAFSLIEDDEPSHTYRTDSQGVYEDGGIIESITETHVYEFTVSIDECEISDKILITLEAPECANACDSSDYPKCGDGTLVNYILECKREAIGCSYESTNEYYCEYGCVDGTCLTVEPVCTIDEDCPESYNCITQECVEKDSFEVTTEYIVSIAKGISKEVEISEDEIKVNKLKIKANSDSTNSKVSIGNYKDKPESVSDIGGKHVEQYIDIAVTDIDLETAEIIFEVSEEWITSNNIDRNTITLLHYKNGSWVSLPTEHVSGNIYKSTTNSFSVFAITAESVIVNTPPSSSGDSWSWTSSNSAISTTCKPEIICSDWEACKEGLQIRNCIDNNNCSESSEYEDIRECFEAIIEETPKSPAKEQVEIEPDKKTNFWLWAIIVILAALIVFLVYYFKMREPQQAYY